MFVYVDYLCGLFIWIVYVFLVCEDSLWLLYVNYLCGLSIWMIYGGIKNHNPYANHCARRLTQEKKRTFCWCFPAPWKIFAWLWIWELLEYWRICVQNMEYVYQINHINWRIWVWHMDCPIWFCMGKRWEKQ